MEVVEMATNVIYKVDDRTGPWVDVRRWVDDVVSDHTYKPHPLYFTYLVYFIVGITFGCTKEGSL